VGYPPNHACDVYRIFNAKAKIAIKSRDGIWLDKNCSECNMKYEIFKTHEDNLENLLKKDSDRKRIRTKELLVRRMKETPNWKIIK
jgi:transcriptional regulator NrdR family protein